MKDYYQKIEYRCPVTKEKVENADVLHGNGICFSCLGGKEGSYAHFDKLLVRYYKLSFWEKLNCKVEISSIERVINNGIIEDDL